MHSSIVFQCRRFRRQRWPIKQLVPHSHKMPFCWHWIHMQTVCFQNRPSWFSGGGKTITITVSTTMFNLLKSVFVITFCFALFAFQSTKWHCASSNLAFGYCFCYSVPISIITPPVNRHNWRCRAIAEWCSKYSICLPPRNSRIRGNDSTLLLRFNQRKVN